MSGNQATLPLVGSPFQFQQHGESGAWLSDLLVQAQIPCVFVVSTG
jgi:hypothetical protein